MARLARTTMLLFCTFLAGSAFATTYYVDYSSGSDSNNGTSKTSPWKNAPGMMGSSGGPSRLFLQSRRPIYFQGRGSRSCRSYAVGMDLLRNKQQQRRSGLRSDLEHRSGSLDSTDKQRLQLQFDSRQHFGRRRVGRGSDGPVSRLRTTLRAFCSTLR